MDKAPWTAGSSTDPSYDLDLDKAVELIRRSGARHVGLQTPEGLKRAAPHIAKQIMEQTGVEVIMSGDPCYGACDIDFELCNEVDLLLHLGHADLGLSSEKVIFLEAKMKHEIGESVKKAISLLGAKRVGVFTTVQHIHKLSQALDILKAHGIEGVVGAAGGRVKYPGQVLGCCYSMAKSLDVDEYLFIGTGQFHPLGIALATGKKVITADPVTEEVMEIDPEPLLRRRFGAIAKAAESKRFAVLISKKPGQRRMALAKRLKVLGETIGKEMFLVYLDNIEPDRLLNLGIEAAVSTACPRIVLDDAAKYRIPLLTPPEFEILVGEREWEQYAFDEIS